jgi:hypothetical protein
LGCEGATHPIIYEALTGIKPTSVFERQVSFAADTTKNS